MVGGVGPGVLVPVGNFPELRNKDMEFMNPMVFSTLLFRREKRDLCVARFSFLVCPEL